MHSGANSILAELGITRAVNGKGTSTRLGGSNLAPPVIAAMVEAAEVSIDAFDLQVAASRIVSEITGAEAGMVTTGASAGFQAEPQRTKARRSQACPPAFVWIALTCQQVARGWLS